MSNARRSDWRIQPLPEQRSHILLERTYSSEEFERIQAGQVPEVMEDKWFLFFEEPWLYIHQSWTGYSIYQVCFDEAERGARVVEVLVNRDPSQYKETNDASDVARLGILLDARAGRDVREAMLRYISERKR